MKKIITLLAVVTFLQQSTIAQNENALNFDGFDDQVTAANASAQIVNSTAGISISCWVYASNPSPAFPNFDGIVGFRNESNFDFYLLHLNATTLEARFRNSQNVAFTTTVTGFQINTWQHLAMTYDGTTLRVYRNGVLNNSVAATGSFSNTSVPFNMGNIPFISQNFRLNGSLDEVGLWSRALTAAQINCMYKYGHDDSDTDLKLYYKFNQGIANGNNTTITMATDQMGNINGLLSGLALTGTSSNFIAGVVQHGAVVDTICKGDFYSFGNQFFNQSGIFWVKLPASEGCDSLVKLTLTAKTIDTIAFVVNDTTIMASQDSAVYQWIDCATGVAIAGATNRSFIAQANGSYRAVITYNGCTDTTNCLAITKIGLDEYTTSLTTLYPNPATDHIILKQAGMPLPGVLKIVGIGGVVLHIIEIDPAAENNIKLQLPAGFYTATFETNTGLNKIFKLLIQ